MLVEEEEALDEDRVLADGVTPVGEAVRGRDEEVSETRREGGEGSAAGTLAVPVTVGEEELRGTATRTIFPFLFTILIFIFFFFFSTSALFPGGLEDGNNWAVVSSFKLAVLDATGDPFPPRDGETILAPDRITSSCGIMACRFFDCFPLDFLEMEEEPPVAAASTLRGVLIEVLDVDGGMP